MKAKLMILLLMGCYIAHSQSLPTPKNLKAELVGEEKDRYIQLTWDQKQVGDTLTESYYVFRNFPPDNRLLLDGYINRLNTATCRMEIKKPYAAVYRYAVKAVSYYPYEHESVLSDTVEVMVPSIKLPLPAQTAASISDGVLKVSWEYDDILDLKGFILAVGKESFEVQSDYRSFEMDIDADALMVTIQAVSQSGVVSDVSKVIASSR